MKFNVWQHVDSYIEVVVDTDSEEKALELGQAMLTEMDDAEFSKQVLANIEMGETETEEIPGPYDALGDPEAHGVKL